MEYDDCLDIRVFHITIQTSFAFPFQVFTQNKQQQQFNHE